jgi:hypothetical protein
MIKPVKQIRLISIESRHNGYQVQVGCQAFVFENASDVIDHLRNYFGEPAKVEVETMNAYNELNKGIQPAGVPIDQSRSGVAIQRAYREFGPQAVRPEPTPGDPSSSSQPD